jgi:hypothetical protein
MRSATPSGSRIQTAILISCSSRGDPAPMAPSRDARRRTRTCGGGEQPAQRVKVFCIHSITPSGAISKTNDEALGATGNRIARGECPACKPLARRGTDRSRAYAIDGHRLIADENQNFFGCWRWVSVARDRLSLARHRQRAQEQRAQEQPAQSRMGGCVQPSVTRGPRPEAGWVLGSRLQPQQARRLLLPPLETAQGSMRLPLP